MQVRQNYDLEVHQVPEFGMEGLEDWLVLCRPKAAGAGETTEAHARRWSAEVDSLCFRSRREEVDWWGFQERLRPAMLEILGKGACGCSLSSG